MSLLQWAIKSIIRFGTQSFRQQRLHNKGIGTLEITKTNKVNFRVRTTEAASLSLRNSIRTVLYSNIVTSNESNVVMIVFLT